MQATAAKTLTLATVLINSLCTYLLGIESTSTRVSSYAGATLGGGGKPYPAGLRRDSPFHTYRAPCGRTTSNPRALMPARITPVWPKADNAHGLLLLFNM